MWSKKGIKLEIKLEMEIHLNGCDAIYKAVHPPRPRVISAVDPFWVKWWFSSFVTSIHLVVAIRLLCNHCKSRCV